MKTIFYSALIGTLALAVSAQAADDNKHQQKKAPARRGAPAAQHAQMRAHGPAQANVHHNQPAMHAQQRAINPGHNKPAIAHQNKPQNHGVAAAHHGNLNQGPGQPNVGKNHHQNANIAAAQNKPVAPQQQQAAAAPQQNGGHHLANLKPNTHRHVGLVNHWNSSRFSGEKYSAFRNYHRERHDRDWYHSHYNRFVVFGGGNYYWNNGYWYPAWGYDSGYRYNYDGPIYGYNDLNPDQVVVNVQTQLQQNGYYDGPIDGSIGPITREAIANFQADQGLAVTSAIDQPTLETLGLI
jgi:Putative peptidoglycan binding domain